MIVLETVLIQICMSRVKIKVTSIVLEIVLIQTFV